MYKRIESPIEALLLHKPDIYFATNIAKRTLKTNIYDFISIWKKTEHGNKSVSRWVSNLSWKRWKSQTTNGVAHGPSSSMDTYTSRTVMAPSVAMAVAVDAVTFCLAHAAPAASVTIAASSAVKSLKMQRKWEVDLNTKTSILLARSREPQT